MKSKYIEIKDESGLLSSIGIMTQHFPNYTNRDTEQHSTNVVLLSVILEGEATHIIEDRSFPQKGPSVGITHYGEHHKIITGEKGINVLNIYLDLKNHALPEFPEKLSDTLPFFLPFHPHFQNRLNRVLTIPFSNEDPVFFLAFALHKECQNRAIGFEAAVWDYWRLFLIECCRRVKQNQIISPEAYQKKAPPVMEALRRFIDKNYAEDFSLDVLSEKFNISKSYVCHGFKSYTGKTVLAYRLERRIQAAMVRLRNSRDKVASIALDCGFNDISFFNRTFKRLTGVSPKAYRDTNRR